MQIDDLLAQEGAATVCIICLQ